MGEERSAKAQAPDRDEPTDEELAETEPLPTVVWAARSSVYFLAQGGITLLSYAYYGFDTDPQSFSVGFRLDPLQAGVNLVWGLVGGYIGFFRPRYATIYVLAFAAFYTALVTLCTFTPYNFGIQLDGRAQLFYWLLAPTAWVIGLYGLWRERRSG